MPEYWSSHCSSAVTIPSTLHEDVGWIPGLALSGSGIGHCYALWCRLQTQLGSSAAAAVAGSCSSDSTPSLGSSICCRCSHKKQKRKRKKKKKKKKERKKERERERERKMPVILLALFNPHNSHSKNANLFLFYREKTGPKTSIYSQPQTSLMSFLSY